MKEIQLKGGKMAFCLSFWGRTEYIQIAEGKVCISSSRKSAEEIRVSKSYIDAGR